MQENPPPVAVETRRVLTQDAWEAKEEARLFAGQAAESRPSAWTPLPSKEWTAPSSPSTAPLHPESCLCDSPHSLDANSAQQYSGS